MATLPVSDYVQQIREAGTLNDKVAKMKEICNAKPAVKQIFKYAYDPEIEWLLPEGPTPYTPCPPEYEVDGMLWAEMRRLYLFVKGGNNNLNPRRREQLWVELLGSVLPEDAKLLDQMKDRKIEGISDKVVLRAFPDLFKPTNIKKKETE